MSTPTTTYTWSVSQLERRPADGIVLVVHFTVDANDGTYSANQYFTAGLAAPAEGDTVIPFADLTSDVITGWVKSALDTSEEEDGRNRVSEIEAMLQTRIDEQRTPPLASGLPW